MPEICPTCNGAGWMLDGEGNACPDCQNPEVLGGTGLKGGVLPDDFKQTGS